MSVSTNIFYKCITLVHCIILYTAVRQIKASVFVSTRFYSHIKMFMQLSDKSNVYVSLCSSLTYITATYFLCCYKNKALFSIA